MVASTLGGGTEPKYRAVLIKNEAEDN